MAHSCWLVLSVLSLQTVLTSRGPDGGLQVAPSHGSLKGGNRAYIPAKLVDPFSAGTATIGVAGPCVPAAVWGDSIAPQCGPVVQL